MGCGELVAYKKGEAKEEEEGAGTNHDTIKCSPEVRSPRYAWCCVVVGRKSEGGTRQSPGSLPAPGSGIGRETRLTLISVG